MTKKLTDSGDAGESHGRLSPETLQRLRQLQKKARGAYSSGRDRTEAAEHIIDEMARRQGQKLGPYFEWSLATAEFTARFNEAFLRKPPKESMKKFACAFVDAWPQGMAALRLNQTDATLIANPPYAKDGQWPAYLDDRKSRPGKSPDTK